MSAAVAKERTTEDNSSIKSGSTAEKLESPSETDKLTKDIAASPTKTDKLTKENAASPTKTDKLIKENAASPTKTDKLIKENDASTTKTDKLSEVIAPAADGSVTMDLDIILQGFRESLKDDGLFVDGYIRAYTEMAKFFDVLGTVFSFITSDVYSKLNIMRCYRKSGSADYYISIQSMLQYEKDTPSLSYPSASRTILRLHRALAFTSRFLRKMKTLDMENKLGPAIQPIYADTLAPHHGWLISKAVSAVILLLPIKKTLLSRLFGDDVAKQRYLDHKTEELCDVMDKVYAITQSYYADYEMLNLP